MYKSNGSKKHKGKDLDDILAAPSCNRHNIRIYELYPFFSDIVRIKTGKQLMTRTMADVGLLLSHNTG